MSGARIDAIRRLLHAASSCSCSGHRKTMVPCKQQELTTCACADSRHSSSSATVHGTRHRMSCVWLAPGRLLSHRLRARCGLCCRSMRAGFDTAAVRVTTSRRAVLRLRSAWAGQQRSAVLPRLAGGCEDGLQCEDMQRRQAPGQCKHASPCVHRCRLQLCPATPLTRKIIQGCQTSDARQPPMASRRQQWFSRTAGQQKSTGHVHVPIC